LDGAPDDLVATFLADVVAAEMTYADARNNAAGECIATMTSLRVKFLDDLKSST